MNFALYLRKYGEMLAQVTNLETKCIGFLATLTRTASSLDEEI